MKKIIVLLAFLMLVPLSNSAFARHRVHVNYGGGMYYNYHNPYMSVIVPIRHHSYRRHSYRNNYWGGRHRRFCVYPYCFNSPYRYGNSGFNINISI